MLKANWSNSARERVLGQGREVTPAVSRWLRARLARDQVVAFEPWVEVVAEVGVQWDVPREGRPQLIGVVPMLSDPSGRYRGSDFTPDPNLEHDWRDALYAACDAAEAAQRMGYFGPLGIDACLYRTLDGRTKLRPLQDVNARWTMGRLSLGWRSLLQPLAQGRWLFTSDQGSSAAPPLPLGEGSEVRAFRMGSRSEARARTSRASARVIPTSPARIDGRPPRIQTRVEIVPPPTASTAPAESAAPR